MKISSLALLIIGVYGKNCCKVWKFDIVDLDDWFTLEESYTCTYNHEVSKESGNGWIYTCDDERELFIGRDYWDGVWTIFGTNGLYSNTAYNENYATYWFHPTKLGTDDWSECMVNDFQTSLGTGTGYIGYSDIPIQGNNFRCIEEEYSAPSTTTTTTAITTTTTTTTTSTTTTSTTITTMAATTNTTTVAVTTTATSLAKTPSEWLAMILTNVDSIFDSLNGRTKLYKYWVKRINKFDQRFLKIQKLGCPFPETYEDDSVDLDQSNVCDVS